MNTEQHYKEAYNALQESSKKVYHPTIQELNDLLRDPYYNVGEFSDGYHTFNELYTFRKLYNALLFNEWGYRIGTYSFTDVHGVHWNPKYKVHKSWKHDNGELCFGGGWFIVSAELPTGQISNHYESKDWDLFKVPHVEKSLYPFDGHTSQDVIERMEKFGKTK